MSIEILEYLKKECNRLKDMEGMQIFTNPIIPYLKFQISDFERKIEEKEPDIIKDLRKEIKDLQEQVKIIQKHLDDILDDMQHTNRIARDKIRVLECYAALAHDGNIGLSFSDSDKKELYIRIIKQLQEITDKNER